MENPSKTTSQGLLIKRFKAQGLIEFALILPLIFLLIFGAIDLSRLVITYTAVTSGAREGARFGAVKGRTEGTPNFLNCSGIRNAVRGSTSALVNLTDGMIAITYIDFENVAIGACGAVEEDDLFPGDRIVVTVTAEFEPITPLGLGPYPIINSSAMGLFPGVDY